MARIIKTIEIEGQPAVALFDTGAVYTYIRSTLASQGSRTAIANPVRVSLGGQVIQISEQCVVNGKIDSLDFFTDALPVRAIGRVDGQELDAVIGARTLEQWEMRLDPKTGKPDLEGLRRREFTEF